jgi:hypothetical protein
MLSPMTHRRLHFVLFLLDYKHGGAENAQGQHGAVGNRKRHTASITTARTFRDSGNTQLRLLSSLRLRIGK